MSARPGRIAISVATFALCERKALIVSATLVAKQKPGGLTVAPLRYVPKREYGLVEDKKTVPFQRDILLRR